MILLLLSCLLNNAHSADLSDDYTDPKKTRPENITLKFLALRSTLTQSDSHKAVKDKLDLYHYISSGSISQEELRLAQYPENIRKTLTFLDSDSRYQYIYLHKKFLFFKKNNLKISHNSMPYLAVYDTEANECASLHYLSEDFEVKILEKEGNPEFIPNYLIIHCSTINKTNDLYSNWLIKYSLSQSALDSVQKISTQEKANLKEWESVLNISNLNFKNSPEIITTFKQNELLGHLKKSIDIHAKYGFEMHYPLTTMNHFKKADTISPWKHSLSSIKFNNLDKFNAHLHSMDID